MIAPVCKFCRQQTINLDIQEMNQLSIIVHACYKCDAEYLYWSDSMSLSAIALYTKFKNKKYDFKFRCFNQLYWFSNF